MRGRLGWWLRRGVKVRLAIEKGGSKLGSGGRCLRGGFKVRVRRLAIQRVRRLAIVRGLVIAKEILLSLAECSSKDGAGELKLNSPVVIAWSNSGRNHFIPLVPVKGKPLPRLPPHLQPKVWGSEESELKRLVWCDGLAKGNLVLLGGPGVRGEGVKGRTWCEG